MWNVKRNQILLIVLFCLFHSGCKGETVSNSPGLLKSYDEVFSESLLNEAAKAIESSDAEKLLKLKKQGLDVNGMGLHGYNLLFWSLRSKDVNSFKTLLSLGANPNQYLDSGKSVMHWISEAEDERYLQLALESGGDANSRNLKTAETPLFNAISANGHKNIKLLVAWGADINAQDKFGETAAMAAAALNYYDKVQVLIRLGIDHCIQSRWNKTIFDRLNTAKELMDKSSDKYRVVLHLLETLPKCSEKP